jgi:hypothetical protein
MLDSFARFLQREWVTLLFIAAIAAAWLLLRTRSSGAASIDDFDQKITSGRPVVVEFFSNT